MDGLVKARSTINEVDKKMAELFAERMSAVRAVAEYKKERGLPVYDAQREAELIAKNCSYIADAEIRSYYTEFIGNTIKVSRDYQNYLISGAKIAYSGVPGAFAYSAAKRLFPCGDYTAFSDFNSAYDAVVKGFCDSAVLPIENSYAGEVGVVCDLIFSGPLYINRTLDLPVSQNLLGLPGADEASVKTVISHPQALSQCAEYIKKHGYAVRDFSNTALAAKFVAAAGDPALAAIGDEEAAELYGLRVIARKINGSEQNTTRFAVLSRVQNDGAGRADDNFFLVFSVKNEAGALSEAINVIGRHGYNMRSLHSRPSKTLLWQYYFYMECEGNVRNENGRQMLDELAPLCGRLKLVGSYPSR